MIRRLLPAIVGLLLVGHAFAAVNVSQDNVFAQNTNSTTAAVTLGTATASGSFLYAVCISDSSASHSSVTDNRSNTYTKQKDLDDLGGLRITLWTAPVTTTGSTTTTCNLSASVGARGVYAAEIKGASAVQVTAGQVQSDAVNLNPGTGSNAVTSGNANITTQPALIVGTTISHGSEPTISLGTGFSANPNTPNSGNQSTIIGSLVAERSENKRTTSTGNQAATFTISANQAMITVMAVFTEAGSVPAFTADPAYSARTSNSIDFTATLTDGGATTTLYGVLVASGSGAPSCTQVKAGQNSSGASAVAAVNGTITTTVQKTLTFGSLTNGNTLDAYFCANNATGDTTVKSVTGVYKTPTLTAGPTLASATTTAMTVGYTPDGTHTVSIVVCKFGSTAPTLSQVKAGQCTGGATALSSASKSSSGADTQSLSGQNTATRAGGDVYAAATHSSADSTVYSLTGQLLAPPAGSQYVTASGLPYSGTCSGSSGCSIVTGISPSIVNGDVLKCVTLTSPDAHAFILYSDGSWQIVALGDTARQEFDCDFFDVSLDAWHGSWQNWNGNHAPTQIAAPASSLLLVATGSAMTCIDLTALVNDVEHDTLTYALQSGSWPSGVTLSGGSVCGTPTSAGAYPVTIRVTDITGEYVDLTPFTLTTVGPVTVPNVVGTLGAAATATLEGVYLRAPGASQTNVCSGGRAATEVAGQNPASGSVVSPFSDVALSLATGVCANPISGRTGSSVRPTVQ